MLKPAVLKCITLKLTIHWYKLIYLYEVTSIMYDILLSITAYYFCKLCFIVDVRVLDRPAVTTVNCDMLCMLNS